MTRGNLIGFGFAKSSKNSYTRLWNESIRDNIKKILLDTANISLIFILKPPSNYPEASCFMSLLPAASIFYYKIKTTTREISFLGCKQTVEWREKSFGNVNKQCNGRR
jgi:hypothetical protein